MRIDKSKFSPEELAQYTALVAKATVPDNESDPSGNPAPESAPAGGETNKGEPTQKGAPSPGTAPENPAPSGDPSPEDTKKSEVPPALAAALERMEQMEKSIEMKGLEELAKKYEPMGEKPEIGRAHV